MSKTILFIGPSATGKSYLANLPYKDKLINEPTVGIDYRAHHIGKTKYMIYDTGDFNRYHFIIKDYFSKVDEIFVFANTREDIQICKRKLENIPFKVISDNTELCPAFLLSFNSNDMSFYRDEESPLLTNQKKNKWMCCI